MRRPFSFLLAHIHKQTHLSSCSPLSIKDHAIELYHPQSVRSQCVCTETLSLSHTHTVKDRACLPTSLAIRTCQSRRVPVTRERANVCARVYLAHKRLCAMTSLRFRGLAATSSQCARLGRSCIRLRPTHVCSCAHVPLLI